MKRGELSMEVIIIAAIALLVLVIISYLVIRGGGSVTTGTNCASLRSPTGQPATCATSCDSGYVSNPGYPGCAQGETCCVPLTATS